MICNLKPNCQCKDCKANKIIAKRIKFGIIFGASIETLLKIGKSI